MKTVNEAIWIRLGDLGSYESFDFDFDAIALYLHESNVRPPFNWGKYALYAPPFDGQHNEISFYVGPQEAPDISRGLKKYEKREIEEKLTELINVK